jgi:molybdopterin/thiamine biosynthesis adenylyltransferase
MNLRVLESQWQPFVSRLCKRRDVETAGLILAERLNGGVLLARYLLEIPDEGYLIRRADRIQIDPVTINRLVRRARNEGLSVITAHTHPGSTEPWFSVADDEGDSRLMPSCLAQMPGPHGSLVVAGDSLAPAARVWMEPNQKTTIDVRIVGQMLKVAGPGPESGASQDWFARQRLALGEGGQRTLQRLHVAIVGLGGTGSVAFLQLAHLGVGTITIIDGDRVERSNVSRVLGATVADAGVTWKVDIAARYAEQLGLGTKVHVVRGRLGSDVSVAVLESCDVALSCVDRHLPRALLNRLAYERAIPVIDMGSAFRVSNAGNVVAGVGRVVIIGPDRPCLGCWGHLDANGIRIESLSPEDRAREAIDGYIAGADVPQPSVVAFNTAIAGAAVVELLRMVTGFAGTEEPPMRLSFDFETGTVRRNRLAANDHCTICRRQPVTDEASQPASMG